jgi:hypothetical protein
MCDTRPGNRCSVEACEDATTTLADYTHAYGEDSLTVGALESGEAGLREQSATPAANPVDGVPEARISLDEARLALGETKSAPALRRPTSARDEFIAPFGQATREPRVSLEQARRVMGEKKHRAAVATELEYLARDGAGQTDAFHRALNRQYRALSTFLTEQEEHPEWVKGAVESYVRQSVQAEEGNVKGTRMSKLASLSDSYRGLAYGSLYTRHRLADPAASSQQAQERAIADFEEMRAQYSTPAGRVVAAVRARALPPLRRVLG